MVVTELLGGGSIEDVLSSGKGRPSGARQQQAMRWAQDLMRAVTYMHESEPPVVHRDLRPSNLLLSAAGVLKLTGFGSALVLTKPRELEWVDRGQNRAAHRPAGTAWSEPRRPSAASGGGKLTGSARFSVDGRWRPARMADDRFRTCDSACSAGSADAVADTAAAPAPTRYTAPELYGGRGSRAGLEDRADVFSAAVVVWALFAGRAPYPGLSDAAAAAAAADPAVRLRPSMREMGGAKELRAVLSEGWQYDAERRPRAGRLLEAFEDVQLRAVRCGAGCVVA
jgi:serine/threonine protein kinase